MYWKAFACIVAAASLFAGSAAACESSAQETTYVSSTSDYTPSSDTTDVRYEAQPQPVGVPVQDQNDQPDPGGAGISASFFL